MDGTKQNFKKADPKLLKTVTGKILVQYLLQGALQPGEEIGADIDQTLTQDATNLVLMCFSFPLTSIFNIKLLFNLFFTKL